MPIEICKRHIVKCSQSQHGFFNYYHEAAKTAFAHIYLIKIGKNGGIKMKWLQSWFLAVDRHTNAMANKNDMNELKMKWESEKNYSENDDNKITQ